MSAVWMLSASTPGVVAAQARRDASPASLLTMDSAEPRCWASLARVKAARMAKPAPSGDMTAVDSTSACSRWASGIAARTTMRLATANKTAAPRQIMTNNQIG